MLLVPSLHKKTFGNLEEPRDKKLDSFPFFSFFSITNSGLFFSQQLLHSPTSIKGMK
jgi:hypothetical protein